MSDRLSALDTSFLYLESPTTPMHISSLAVYDGPTPDTEELRMMLASRLHLIPRFRQRVATVPFNQHRPVWTDDQAFDLNAHLRHVSLPAPGTEAQLHELAGQLLSIPLDRSRPLWEMWLIDSLERARFAILSKTHHALFDGVTGVDLHAVLLDASPEPSDVTPEWWTPGHEPTPAQLLASGIRERATESMSLLRSLGAAARDPRKAVRRVGAFAQGAASYVRAAGRPAPPSPLNVEIGTRRRYETVRTSLDDFRTIGRAFGATVNDVLLAVVAGAIRHWLVYRDVVPSDLRVMVPVSVRTKAERGVAGNRLVMFMVPLPVGVEDPVQRLCTVHSTMEREKASKQAQAEDALTTVAGFAPPQVVAQLTKMQSVGRWFNLLATNVVGPQFPLYLRGRRLIDLFPQAPLAANQALAIAVLSYDGNMNFGLLADRDAIGDLDVVADAIHTSLRELMQASEIEEVIPIPVGVGLPLSGEDIPVPENVFLMPVG